MSEIEDLKATIRAVSDLVQRCKLGVDDPQCLGAFEALEQIDELTKQETT